jgi:hypothetical protein
MPRPRGDRLVWRNQGGVPRAYGRFADYEDVGGHKYEALIAKDEKLATDDEVIARQLIAARLAHFQERRRDRTLLGVTRTSSLANFVSRHLKAKKLEEECSDAWLVETERHLQAALDFFDELRSPAAADRMDCDPALASELGADRDLASITVGHMKAYRQWLARHPGGRKKTILDPGTQRHYLNGLGNLFASAIEAEVYQMANPVWSVRNKPKGSPAEARWLEVWEGALLVASARTFPYDGVPDRAGLRLRGLIESTFGPAGLGGACELATRMRALGKLTDADRVLAYCDGEKIASGGFLAAAAHVFTVAGNAVDAEWLRRGDGMELNRPFIPHRLTHPLLGGFLLTGMRQRELFGLEVDDVSPLRRKINLRPNAWRGLKTEAGARLIPYWPQLRELWDEWMELRAKLFPTSFRLVFPSPRLWEREGREGMLTDVRKALDSVARRVGFEDGEIRTKRLRHTYCSTRSQTLDRGAPVSINTVAREMGHEGKDTTERIYLHFQEVPHRSEFVEYRVDQHAEVEDLVKRLRPLRAA